MVQRRRKRTKAVNLGSEGDSSDPPVLTSSDSEAGGDAEPMTDSDQSIDVDKLQSASQSSVKGSCASSSVRPAPPTPAKPLVKAKKISEEDSTNE